MPHNPSTVAAKSIDGKVLVMNTKTNQAQSLMGLTSGGGGLDWSDMDEGLIACGSGDHRICIWKIESPQPQLVFDNHPCDVTVILSVNLLDQDISWNRKEKDQFGVAGNDGSVAIYDIRQSSYSSMYD